MDADWITSPSARRVQQHAQDSRPAWLWSQDGQLLIWQNDAAQLFLAKLKKHGLRLSAPAVPIKGQIARNIRLGSPGRTSLARIQFLAGDKPASSTCATTPLVWQDGQPVLLVVGVDPIAPDVLAAFAAQSESDAPQTDSAEHNDDSVTPLVSDDPALDAEAEAQTETETETEAEAETKAEAGPAADSGTEAVPAQGDEWSSPAVLPDEAPEPDQPDAPVLDDAALAAAHEALDEVEHHQPEHDAEPRPVVADETAYARELESWRAAEPDGVAALELVSNDDDVPEPESADDAPVARSSRLSRLVDRLAEDEALFTPLTEADDAPPPEAEKAAEDIDTAEAPSEAAIDNQDPEPTDPVETPALFRITGQGFVPDAVDPDPIASGIEAEEGAELTEAEADLPDLAAVDGPDVEAPDTADTPAERLSQALAELTPEKPADPEAVERVSRYNFDELARILTDRVGEPAASATPARNVAETGRTGALINLGGETLVLNRLPLGILVFRDQQVLFANRAITEMVGYSSVESLRNAGLAAVFPATGADDEAGAGPVNHLVQRDGTLVPVTARLQSISWQGKPALMLSASTTEVRTGHEAAVGAFARGFADLRGDGFFEATRAGVISAITPRSATLLGVDGPLEGKSLSALIAPTELAALREFLERPARFAETARPAITLRSLSGRGEIALFAQGQAGVVTGYFGLVRGRATEPARLAGPADIDPALLGRISRGVRRPLNTIIGFADMMRSEAVEGSERYQAYAQDISAAGQEIAALVDELEDYARLRDGRYLPQRASIELTALLESCVLRIRQQANGARVIVRNAISETLPRVTADRASLAQAVLNLLASAIDQTPTGGGVVISAHHDEDGSIAVHVRDSSTNAVDMAERFVVFRDGVGRDGQAMVPVRSSIGLALTRSLLAVNAFSLSVDPAGEQGMLFTMKIPADLVEKPAQPEDKAE